MVTYLRYDSGFLLLISLSLCLICILRSRMVGGGAFQPYLPDKDSLQGWVGSVSSGRDVPGLRVAQEALLTPVCDTGYSHVLRGRFLQGTQPFDRGLGFSHQEAGQHSWEQEPRRGQVRFPRRPPAASCAWMGNISIHHFFELSDGRQSFRLIYLHTTISIHLTTEESSKCNILMNLTRWMCCVVQHMGNIYHV